MNRDNLNRGVNMDQRSMKPRPEPAGYKKRAEPVQEPQRDYAAYAVFGLALALLVTSGIFGARYLSRGGPMIPEGGSFEWIEDIERKGRALADRFSGGAVSRQDPVQGAKSHIQRGRQLYSKSEFEKALVEFARAEQLDPKNPEPLCWKGRALVRLQRYEEAFEAFQKTVGLRPDYRDAHDNLAWLYERKRDYDRALLHLNKSLQLGPDNAWAHFHRARLLHNRGEWEKALEDARRACELKSQDGCRLYEEYKAESGRR